jgi:protein-S-isoprenylcysteine O-methyltransferase Ste14
MLTIGAQLVGIAAFFVITLIIGRAIRRSPTPEAAQRLSRVSHALYWLGMMVPEYVGVVWPGLNHYDELVGLPSLPWPIMRWLVGVPLIALGGFLAVGSIRALKQQGEGMAAFKLTRRVVETKVYERMRNPMSLGLYLQAIGVSLLAGSSYLLLLFVFLFIPAHAFNLKYFEEQELRARHGPSYDEYCRRVPFLIPRLGPRHGPPLSHG